MPRQGAALRSQGDVLPHVGRSLGIGVKPGNVDLNPGDVDALLAGGVRLQHRDGVAAGGQALLYRLAKLRRRELDSVLHG